MQAVTMGIAAGLGFVLTAIAAGIVARRWVRPVVASRAAPDVAPTPAVQEPLQTPPQGWYEDLNRLVLRFNDLEGRCMSALDESDRNYKRARASEERNRNRLARAGEEDEEAQFDAARLQLVEDEPEPQQQQNAPVVDAKAAAARRRLEERRARVGGG